MMLGMALSGALAGMGGGYGHRHGRSADPRPVGRIGFTAIALALLADLRPSGVVMAALLFGRSPTAAS